jgi:hypothetical protein
MSGIIFETTKYRSGMPDLRWLRESHHAKPDTAGGATHTDNGSNCK